ncbi:hypothetical protein [Flavobacterium sp.]|uniref:hypothetical protein n=1 Tax=Flavobacterium sp. TaxID=239 RepID=UPI0026323E0F|nr:hypothetical protein [Flavobacterium sp.]MDD3005822.1 hypothetical protein [Flavobacterium sp.]
MKLIAHTYLQQDRLFHQGGKEVFQADPNTGNVFKSMYHFLEMDYPKFYKMDSLSKIAILAAETLIKENPRFTFESVQLIFMNAHASYSADTQFQASYLEAKKPSPSHFVYTLANIPMGEIAIKYKIMGETIFLISEEINVALFVEQIQFAFQKNTQFACCAWLEINPRGIAECFLFLVANTNEKEDPKAAINLEQAIRTILKKYRNE